MTVGDPTLSQIVWRKLDRDPIAIHDLDSVAPESSRHCREDRFLSRVKLDGEHSGFEFLNHLTHYFDCVFFWQIVPFKINEWNSGVALDTQHPLWYARPPAT